MATLSLEDDSDPNLTHFAHKDEFMALLRSFLADFDAGDCADHGPQLTSMGAIVSEIWTRSSFLYTCKTLDAKRSSITICPRRGYSIPASR